MKLLLTLTVSCMILASCQAACFHDVFEPKIINGVLVPQDGCIDPFDNNRHPSGSEWNTADCLRCTCYDSGMTCCDRYGGLASAPGCKVVLDHETCRYKFYSIDNPSEPCLNAPGIQ